MNKIQKKFYESLKESYPDKIRSRIDAKFHVEGKQNDNPVIYRGKMAPEFEASFKTDFGKRGQAYAIFSSAIMAYNFFHWVAKNKPINIDGLIYDEVMFEFPLRTFKNRKSSAKMDVVLLNRETAQVLFIESKFTEHFCNKKFVIPEAYRDKSNYFKGGHGEEWESIVKSCAEEMSQQKGYCEGIKQEICHLVGICASRTKSYTGKRPMENGYSWRLRNIVFNPKAEACNDSPYDNYKRLYTEFKKQVKKQVGTKMNSLIEIMDYKPIWSAICKAFPYECDPYRKFIWERYMRFAAE